MLRSWQQGRLEPRHHILGFFHKYVKGINTVTINLNSLEDRKERRKKTKLKYGSCLPSIDRHCSKCLTVTPITLSTALGGGIQMRKLQLRNNRQETAEEGLNRRLSRPQEAPDLSHCATHHKGKQGQHSRVSRPNSDISVFSKWTLSILENIQMMYVIINVSPSQVSSFHYLKRDTSKHQVLCSIAVTHALSCYIQ